MRSNSTFRHDHSTHHPKTLAAKVLGQDSSRAGYVGLLLRGVLGTDEDAVNPVFDTL